MKKLVSAIAMATTLLISGPAKADLNWEEILKELSIEAAKELPVGGSALALVIKLLFPADDKIDAEELQASILDQTKKMIDQAILENNDLHFTYNLNSIFTQMTYFGGATTDDSKCSYLRIIIDDSNNLFTNMTGLSMDPKEILQIPPHAPQYIPLVATLLPIHMAALRDQYAMHKNCGLNEETVIQALEHGATQYKQAIKNAYNGVPERKKDEKDQIPAQPKVTGLKEWRTLQPSPYYYHPVTNTACPATTVFDDDLTAYFTDNLIDAPNIVSTRYCRLSTSDYTTFESLDVQLRAYLTTRWEHDFVPLVFPFTKLHQYLPNASSAANYDECVQPVDDLQSIILGPISLMTGSFHAANNGYRGPGIYEADFLWPVRETLTGISKVVGYTSKYGTLVGLQFYYGDQPGEFSGQKSDNVHEFVVPADTTITEAEVYIDLGYMDGIAFTLSNKTTSGLFGTTSQLGAPAYYKWTSNGLYTLESVDLAPSVSSGAGGMLVGGGVNLHLYFNPNTTGCSATLLN